VDELDQPQPPDRVPEDVLSMGEGRSPRWGLVLPLLALLLLGVGAYQLVSGPSPATAPPPAAAARDQGGVLLAESPFSTVANGRSSQTTSLLLGHHRVTLVGPAVTQAHRETSAVALGRIGPRWLVVLTSRACHGRGDPQVSYGTARASGRFTAWDSPGARAARTWRSPGRDLLLVHRGSRLELRRTSTGEVLAAYPAGA
jgi:hypothetical protein